MERLTTKQQIVNLQKHVDKEFIKMKVYVDEKISPLHDYMIGQQGASTLSKDLVKIILALIALATVLAGARSLT